MQDLIIGNGRIADGQLVFPGWVDVHTHLVQHSVGYRHTFVAGAEVSADGEATGALPGELIRGARPTPK